MMHIYYVHRFLYGSKHLTLHGNGFSVGTIHPNAVLQSIRIGTGQRKEQINDANIAQFVLTRCHKLYVDLTVTYIYTHLVENYYVLVIKRLVHVSSFKFIIKI